MSSTYEIESFKKVKRRIRRNRRNIRSRTARIRRIIRTTSRPRYRRRTITRVIRYPRYRRVVYSYRYPSYTYFSNPLYRTIFFSPAPITNTKEISIKRKVHVPENNLYLLVAMLAFGFMLGYLYFNE